MRLERNLVRQMCTYRWDISLRRWGRMEELAPLLRTITAQVIKADSRLLLRFRIFRGLRSLGLGLGFRQMLRLKKYQTQVLSTIRREYEHIHIGLSRWEALLVGHRVVIQPAEDCQLYQHFPCF